MRIIKIFVLISSFAITWSWENIPQIPANRRTQFYLLKDDGGYNFGYDSGDGSNAQQKSTGQNQVEGSYSYVDDAGRTVNVQYTSGVNGFVPRISIDGKSQTTSNNAWKSSNSHAATTWKAQQNNNKIWSSQKHEITPSHQTKHLSSKISDESQNYNSGDASYKISYNTGDHQREEISDSQGNVRGQYSYVDEAGQHDLQYIAGPSTGFQVVGGSLATSQNSGSLKSSQNIQNFGSSLKSHQSSHSTASASGDRSYSYEFNTGNHAKQETSDSAGNVRGQYSYVDDAGQHDLQYISSPSSGFKVIGGSLANSQNSGSLKSTQNHHQHFSGSSSSLKSTQNSASSGDGSYAYEFNTGNHAKQETSDSAGNVRGSYQYSDESGQHDLTYVAGEKTGFVVTGGSLAVPNGLIGKSQQKNEGNAIFYRTESSQQNSFNAIGNSQQSQRVQNLRQPAGVQSTSTFQSLNSNEIETSTPLLPLRFPNDQRHVDQAKHLHPTFTIIAPEDHQQTSFEYGARNAVIVGFLPPKHDEKFGYIYDTQ